MKTTARRYKVAEAVPSIEPADGGWQIVWALNGRRESSRMRYKTQGAAYAMAASLQRKAL